MDNPLDAKVDANGYFTMPLFWCLSLPSESPAKQWGFFTEKNKRKLDNITINEQIWKTARRILVTSSDELDALKWKTNFQLWIIPVILQD